MPWSTWTTMSPGVRRSRTSLGTTRRSARGRRTRTGPQIAGGGAPRAVPGADGGERTRAADADGAEELVVGDEDDAVGAAGEPAGEAPVDERDRAGGGGLADRVGVRGPGVGGA